MTTTVVIIIGFIIYVGLYFTYGKKIERDGRRTTSRRPPSAFTTA